MARLKKPLTNQDLLAGMSRQLVTVLRELLLPLKRRVMNHDEHIKFLLNAVKELHRDRETDRAEMKRLRECLEMGDCE
jgi:hypothetical protein